jgi:uncharacterized protein YdeI (YjbR/CyaY-like superfamily)
MMIPSTPVELATAAFSQQHDWEIWLAANHDHAKGIWLQFSKKGSGIASVSYDEALESALCYGWIDGLKKSHSTEYWLQKFTPRSKKSIWSKINRNKATALIAANRMQAAGLAEVERAKRDGRWDAAYDSASQSTIPADFQAALEAHPAALEFYQTLESRNRYALLFRIQTAKKPETRQKRIAEFIAMLIGHKKIHP